MRRNTPVGGATPAGGFTLLELLVVIAIIGIIATIGLPRMRGMSRGNAMKQASRQLADDLTMARLRALSSRADVYVVFLPALQPADLDRFPSQPKARKTLLNVFDSQLAAYAIVTDRAVGDQPGQGSSRYMTEWRRLPEGVVFAPIQFGMMIPGAKPSDLAKVEPSLRFLPLSASPLIAPFVSFPNTGTFDETGTPLVLPAIKFNAFGQMADTLDRTIRLTRGSVFVTRDAQGLPTGVDTSVAKSKGSPVYPTGDVPRDYPPGALADETWLMIAGLTGRVTVASNPDDVRPLPPP